MSDIKIGGSNGEGAETYIGVFGEIWIDRTGGIRRSNGSTPGGVIIGGGDITSLTASVEANTTVIGYHTALINATDITHASNTATLQGNIDTNTASIAALPSPRITLTIDQSAIGDINNKTEINADTYSHVFVYNDVSAARYFKLLDGSYDGQEISINRYHAGGYGIQIEALFEQTDGTSSLSLKAVGKPDMSPPTNGTFVWNGNMWWKV
jgi:hypothetical protein